MENNKVKGCAGCFFNIIKIGFGSFAFALVYFASIMAVDLWNHDAYSSWKKIPALILEVNSSNSELEVVYEYTAKNKIYQANTISPFRVRQGDVYTSLRQKLSTSQKNKTPFPCYINPHNVQESFLICSLNSGAIRIQMVFVPILLFFGLAGIACLFEKSRTILFRLLNWETEEKDYSAIVSWNPREHSHEGKILSYIPSKRLIIKIPFPSFDDYAQQSRLFLTLGSFIVFATLAVFIFWGFYATLVELICLVSVLGIEYHVYSKRILKRSEIWDLNFTGKVIYRSTGGNITTYQVSQLTKVVLGVEETQIFRGQELTRNYNVTTSLIYKENELLIGKTGKKLDLEEAKYHGRCFANTIAQNLNLAVDESKNIIQMETIYLQSDRLGESGSGLSSRYGESGDYGE